MTTTAPASADPSPVPDADAPRTPTPVPSRSNASWRAIRLVAGREVRASVQKRSYWIGVAITLAIVLAVSILPGILGGDGTTTRDVGLVGASRELRAPLEAIDRADPDLRLRIRTFETDDAARAAARDGDVDAAVVGDRIVVKDDVPDSLAAILDRSARAAQVNRGVADGAIDEDVAEGLASPSVLRVEALDPTDDDEQARRAMATFGMFLLFAQIFSFGYAVAGGIVEEKSSRVVEVLLAKVRPSELLTGKILGTWVLTTAQMVAFAVIGVVGASATGSLDLPPGWPGVIATLFLWYLVAYLFFACVFAICGALAASPEEMQSTTMPAMFLVMIGYFAAFAAIGDPSGTVAVVASFFPSSAPMVMPLRAAVGEVPGWQVALSVAITLGIGALLVPVAGRIYRGSVLQTRQTKLGAAWRSARS